MKDGWIQQQDTDPKHKTKEIRFNKVDNKQ